MMKPDYDEEDGEDNGLDNGSKMKAMKAIMNFADDQESGDLRAKKAMDRDSPREQGGGLSDPNYMKDEDEEKGFDVSKLLSMFGK